ncbi:MAG: 4Fe-4S dicluster domain-containing protein [Alphaproteobacteria bacterium]|nr:MAG: 4Fe-4S dicluster domain-containing protein [Alphaproteobacteria bacterium]
MTRLFSSAPRPAHLGPLPAERLARADRMPDLSLLPPTPPLAFRADDPLSIIPALGHYQAMMDATRDGPPKRERATIPEDPEERSRHLRAFAHFCDAPLAGVCRVPDAARLEVPHRNPDVDRLAERLRTLQPRTFAAGIDVILAGLREALDRPLGAIEDHGHAIVILVDETREPWPDEPGTEWIRGAGRHRAALRAMEVASVLAAYLRALGHAARAHSASAADVDLGRLAVAAGLGVIDTRGPEPVARNPFFGTRFGLAAVTTTLELAPDLPLAADARPPSSWFTGLGRHRATRQGRDPFRRRRFMDGPLPFETLKRVDTPTTYIDRANVARVPKRANMFARSLFGDFGKAAQDGARNGNYVRKSASGFAFRPALGAFTVLQEGEARGTPHPTTGDAARNAANVKGTLYWLGADAVGLSECPEWAYYSHDTRGEPITPYHREAISVIVDQGWETMEGASGDDWISVAQSMRAYLRFSLLGGVLAEHLRRLGHDARVHSVMDDEVLNPPLLLLSGLGEVSRIGEVILNPLLGPRLKSGVVTTNMALAHDRPIDFGLQRFCEGCNKCARECPSGAITAGPKRMFNGYEIWKSDSQKCTLYRVTQAGGAMCGRCMKTCPWNLEGIFAEAPFRWLATRLPQSAPVLQWLDDRLGRGRINPAKRWWWDLEMVDDGPYGPPRQPANRRELQPKLKLRHEDQTLAVYPAPLAPPPFPWPFPADREAGIRAYREMIDAAEHRRRRAAGLPPEHVYVNDRGEWPVIKARIARVLPMTERIRAYELEAADGGPLPAWEAGAHVDVVIAPEFFRQYSLAGDPARRDRYLIAIQREDDGRGGSKLAHRIFAEGRVVFISKPINHFPLAEEAPLSLLMGAGVGVTPMLAMAHRLHALGRAFRLHYSVPSRAEAAFRETLAAVPWAGSVHWHVSAEGTRADPEALIAAARDAEPGVHVYACGPDRYIRAVTEAAEAAGLPDAQVHFEYFSVPEEEERPRWPFRLRLARSGTEVEVPEGVAATDALLAAGVAVDVKCADGLCGVCRARLTGGAVDHRDFVLSKEERQRYVILCRSRAAEPGGTVEIDL